MYFPFQVLTVLSDPDADYDGGEFVLMEQRPRAQSRAHVLRPARGAFVIFPTRERPQKGKNGYHRTRSRRRSGRRRLRGHDTPLGMMRVSATNAGIVRITGSPNAVRAAGSALATNPLPILVSARR